MYHYAPRLQRPMLFIILISLLCWAVQAVNARPSATCQLNVVGSKRKGLQQVDLRCNTSVSGGPIKIGINSTLLTSQFTKLFQGVEISGNLPCQRRAAQLTKLPAMNLTRLPFYPLMYFCGDYDVEFSSVSVTGVHLVHDDLGYSTVVVAFGEEVRATLRQGVLVDNTVSNVVRATEASMVELVDVWVKGNTGRVGAGVLATGNSTVSVHNNSTFVANSAANGFGGAAATVMHANMTIIGTKFVNNSNGGARAHGNSTMTIINSAFLENARVGDLTEDGGVYVQDYARVSLTNTKFINNSDSAVVAINDSAVTIADSTFLGNTAVKVFSNFIAAGGAASVKDNAKMTISNTTISENSGQLGGGLYGGGNAHLSLTGSTLTGNKASIGGAICLQTNCTLSVRSSQIVQNTGMQGGGGLMVYGDGLYADAAVENINLDGRQQLHVDIHDSNITGNRAAWGGGMYLSFGNATIHNSTLGGNTVSIDGGGVHVSNRSTLTVSSSILIHNNGGACGGGIFVDHKSNNVTASGSFFIQNKAGAGGGLCGGTDIAARPEGLPPDVLVQKEISKDTSSSTVHVSNCTFKNNTAEDRRGRNIFVDLSINLSIQNDSNIRIHNRSVVWIGRRCFVGETQNNPTDTPTACELCPASTYSLDPRYPCAPCNASAYCAGGGALIVPQPGFWNADGNGTSWPNCTLDKIIRCPNQQACRHSPQELEQLSPHNLDASSPENTWTKYQQKQCSAKYTGLLCSSCQPKYGQTDAFTCDACLGVRTDGQGFARGEVNRRGIILMLFGYGVVFAVVIWFTIQMNIRENWRQQRDEDMRELRVTDVMKALIMYAQYLAGIIAKLPVSWPHAVAQTISGLSSAWSWAFGSAASLDCLLTPADGVRSLDQAGLKALLTMAAPVVMFVAISMCQIVWWHLRPWLITWICCAVKYSLPVTSRVGAALFGDRFVLAQPRAKLQMWFMRMDAQRRNHPDFWPYMTKHWIVTLLVNVFFFYPAYARVAVGMFACVTVCGHRYWVLDMRQACPVDSVVSVQGKWAVGLGVPAVLLCAAVPLIVVCFLWRAVYKNNLQEPWFIERYSFMYSDYESKHVVGGWLFRQGYNWHELAGMVKHRLTLVWDAIIHFQTVLLVFVSVYGMVMHEYYQVLILSAAFGWYLILIVWLRPFRVPASQSLQGASVAVLFGTTLCILTFVQPEGFDDHQLKGYQAVKGVMGVIVLVVNILLIALGAWLLAVSMYRQFRKNLYVEDLSRQGQPAGGLGKQDAIVVNLSESLPVAGSAASGSAS